MSSLSPDRRDDELFWDSLVNEMRGIVAHEIQRAASGPAANPGQWRPELERWRLLALPLLKRWCRASRVSTSAARRFRRHLDLAPELPIGSAVNLLASYSLFRLKPYRRAIVWEHFTSELIPREYSYGIAQAGRRQSGFVVGQEAALTS